MEDDWGLHAVVRGCAAVTSTTTTTSSTTTTTSSNISTASSVSSSSLVTPSCGGFPTFCREQGARVLSLSEPFEARRSIPEVHELWRPFFPKSQLPYSLKTSPLSLSSASFSYSSSAPKSTQTQQKQHQLPNKQSPAGSVANPRSKRRKNQLKKVCQVPAEALSSDIWAWRKYGQKPIKGSPYPRGYYRCSSSKVCLARKQVERNRSDPTMFIVTYTAEHNHPAPTHRNSLAGSTRQKPLTPQKPAAAAAAVESDGALTAKPISPAISVVEEEHASQGKTTKSESKEEKEENLMDDDDDEEENEFGFSNNMLTDDFFEGLDELTGSPPLPPSAAAAGDFFSDPFSAGIAPPAWVANDAASAAGTGS